MATVDLQAATNLLNRVLDKIKLESKAFSASILAVIIAVLGLLIAVMSLRDSTTTTANMDAGLRAQERHIDLAIKMQEDYLSALLERSDEQWAQAYKELEREKRLLQLKVDEHRAAMMAHGIDPNFHLEGESN